MARHKKVGRKRLPKKILEENIRRQTRAWQKKATKVITLRFHLEHDKDILEHLSKQTNKNDYVRQLIKKDMAK